MSNMNPKDAQDAAFDARCRAALEGRAVDAPVPSESLFAAAEPAGNNGIRIAALALVIAGTAAWGVYRSDAPDSISEEAPVTEAEVPSEITGVSTPDAAAVELEPIASETAAVPPAPGAEPEPVASSSPSGSSNEPGVMPAAERVGVSASEASSTRPTAAMEPEVTPKDIEDAPVNSVEAPVDVQEVSEPHSPVEEEAPGEEADKAPTLTLPLTLPSGGGL